MPSYRHVISRNKIHQLEHYLFSLLMYSESGEFFDLPSEKQRNIKFEVSFISITLQILYNAMGGTGNNELPVVGWQIPNPYTERGYMKIFYFPSASVAGLVTGANKSKITAVCKRKRVATGGWVFRYQEEYDREESFIYEPGRHLLEFKSMRYDKKEETTPANGDV